MDKNLKEKEEQIRKKIENQNYKIETISTFLSKYESYYSNEESIQALKRIKLFLSNQKQLLDNLNNELKQIDEQLKRNCKHEIIINGEYCAFCKTKFHHNDIPKTSLFIIKSTNIMDLIKIDQIIKNNTIESNYLTYLEDQLDELQYSTDIKVKRLNI